MHGATTQAGTERLVALIALFEDPVHLLNKRRRLFRIPAPGRDETTAA
jgi:hypothetical protein